jgi:ribosomal protein S18 acetylase RimI-like enzyme
MNESHQREVRTLEQKDLSQIAHLHQRAFPESALTRLGLEPVKRYYVWLLTGPHESISIGVFNDDNALLGFCFAGVFHGALSGYLAQNRKFLTFWLLIHPWLVFNPIVIDRLKIALGIFRKRRITLPRTKNDEATQKQKSYGVLSIATDPSSQGSGVGRQLMEVVEQQALAEGFTRLHLTVHPGNAQAVNFYQYCGWEKSNNAEPWEGRMVKHLTQQGVSHS